MKHVFVTDSDGFIGFHPKIDLNDSILEFDGWHRLFYGFWYRPISQEL